MKRSGAKIVNYADDFVLLSKTGAAQALAQARGWLVGCFAHGTPRPSFRVLDIHAAQRVRNLLRRRYKLPSSTARFTYDEVHRNLGALELQSLLC
jgi:hypothetical protein